MVPYNFKVLNLFYDYIGTHFLLSFFLRITPQNIYTAEWTQTWIRGSWKPENSWNETPLNFNDYLLHITDDVH